MKTPKTRGFYEFKDGTVVWFAGLSASEQRKEIAKHGASIKFTHTNEKWGGRRAAPFFDCFTLMR